MVPTLSDDPPALTNDTLLDVLGHHRRRLVLHALARADGVLSDEELVRAVAGTGADSSDESSIRLSLHHVHLPKLRESGLVIGLDETGAVTLGPRADDRVSSVLSAVAGADRCHRP